MKIRSLIGKKIYESFHWDSQSKYYASSDASNLSSIVIKDIRKIYNLQPSNNLRIESQVVLIWLAPGWPYVVSRRDFSSGQK